MRLNESYDGQETSVPICHVFPADLIQAPNFAETDQIESVVGSSQLNNTTL